MLTRHGNKSTTSWKFVPPKTERERERKIYTRNNNSNKNDNNNNNNDNPHTSLTILTIFKWSHQKWETVSERILWNFWPT